MSDVVEEKVETPAVVDAGADSGKPESMLPGWTAGLSKEQKEALISSKAQLPEKMTEFWSGYTQLEARAKNAIVKPAKDAPQEEWAAYRKALGIPESVEGYTFDRPQLPEGMTYSDVFEKGFAQKAHELGMTADQAKGIISWYNGMSISSFEQSKQKQAEEQAQAAADKSRKTQEARQQIQTEFGEQTAAVLNGANAVYSKFPAEVKEAFAREGLDNSPLLIKVLYWYNRATSSDSALGTAAGGGNPEAGHRQVEYGPSFKKRYGIAQ